MHLVTADLCFVEEQQAGLIVNTFCVMPGSDVRIYCAVPDSSVTWTNVEYGTEVISRYTSEVEFGPVFELNFIRFENASTSTFDICANASATVNNIEKYLDGLNVTCSTAILNEMSYFFEINVIGKQIISNI